MIVLLVLVAAITVLVTWALQRDLKRAVLVRDWRRLVAQIAVVHRLIQRLALRARIEQSARRFEAMSDEERHRLYERNRLALAMEERVAMSVRQPTDFVKIVDPS